jgi:DNA-binding transcriptional LysR family regulator
MADLAPAFGMPQQNALQMWSTQGIEPTIYAETLLKRGHVVELQQAIEDIEFLANPTVGEVRIACPEFLTEWLMPRTIDKLSCRFPQVVVRVFQPDTTTLEHRELRERSVDIVVTSDIFDIVVLFDDPHFVVAVLIAAASPAAFLLRFR